MDARTAVLRSEVLSLPAADRAELVVELLASLDDTEPDHRCTDPDEVDRAWGAEMSMRSDQIRSQQLPTISWTDVHARVATPRGGRPAPT